MLPIFPHCAVRRQATPWLFLPLRAKGRQAQTHFLLPPMSRGAHSRMRRAAKGGRRSRCSPGCSDNPGQRRDGKRRPHWQGMGGRGAQSLPEARRCYRATTPAGNPHHGRPRHHPVEGKSSVHLLHSMGRGESLPARKAPDGPGAQHEQASLLPMRAGGRRARVHKVPRTSLRRMRAFLLSLHLLVLRGLPTCTWVRHRGMTPPFSLAQAPGWPGPCLRRGPPPSLTLPARLARPRQWTPRPWTDGYASLLPWRQGQH